MAINDPNKPDNVTFIDPGNKTPEEKDTPDLPQEAGGEATAPEMTADEAAALAAGLRDIGEEQPQPPAPFDIGGEHIPDPDDGLRITGVTFIKGAAKEAEQTAEPDKEAAPPGPGNSRRRGTIPGKERARRQTA